MAAWKEGAYCAGLMTIQQGQITTDEHYGIVLDLSSNSNEPLQPRQETVFLNAAIMNVDYRYPFTFFTSLWS